MVLILCEEEIHRLTVRETILPELNDSSKLKGDANGRSLRCSIFAVKSWGEVNSCCRMTQGSSSPNRARSGAHLPPAFTCAVDCSALHIIISSDYSTLPPAIDRDLSSSWRSRRDSARYQSSSKKILAAQSGLWRHGDGSTLRVLLRMP